MIGDIHPFPLWCFYGRWHFAPTRHWRRTASVMRREPLPRSDGFSGCVPVALKQLPQGGHPWRARVKFDVLSVFIATALMGNLVIVFYLSSQSHHSIFQSPFSPGMVWYLQRCFKHIPTTPAWVVDGWWSLRRLLIFLRDVQSMTRVTRYLYYNDWQSMLYIYIIII